MVRKLPTLCLPSSFVCGRRRPANERASWTEWQEGGRYASAEPALSCFAAREPRIKSLVRYPLGAEKRQGSFKPLATALAEKLLEAVAAAL